ncbi:DUF4240 domain-containing protein [Spirochaeta cellobiosiphila]|uniref:DUF4240 domain-containing protein n=1 Tax=Spirochaeta cellobiosiphila TaxID=504483 RepID=UPI000410BC59|nr:DUF4240 domain-containing protein [Spirochaeta cellobiosiphila]
MIENEFWDLIQKSKLNFGDNLAGRVKYLKETLKEMPEADIFDFEECLRKKIIECDNFKVMAAAKIIDGYVSDDSYIYFRCWLIGKGKQIFDEAIIDPDSLSTAIGADELCDFEELLYIATQAFSEKVGKEEDETFPRNACISKGLDYDFGAPPTKGDDWDEDDLPTTYPKLWTVING